MDEIKQRQKDAQFERKIMSLQQGLQKIQAVENQLEKERDIYHQHQHKICQMEIHGAKESYRFDVTARCKIAEIVQLQITSFVKAKGGV